MRGQLQQQILDMLAQGYSVQETGDYICRHAEQRAPGVLCSIVTVDREGVLHPFAGASVSADYSSKLDGILIGPEVGSCGTAAFLREPVAVHDIFGDARWRPYRPLANVLRDRHGVHACWSSPIMQSDGRVLGAFGFYYREHRGPTEEEVRIVAECVALCSLILEREDARAENERLANFDLLTGFGNRANFIKTLEEFVARAERPRRRSLGILLADIDYLGRVNDAFGYAAGDALIQEAGHTVARIATREATFRVDADEFAVLIEGEEGEEGEEAAALAARLPELAQRILAALAQRSPLAGEHAIPLTMSCGGALFDLARPVPVPTMLQQANLALSHAKQTARGQFVLYSERFAGPITRRVQVLQTLANALAEDRVEAHYQPIVHLETGEPIGLEALCRVRTREGEIIPAGMLVEALHDRSMGYLVTERMLAQVARDLRHWLDREVPVQHVSVNVSMADFEQHDLRERMRDAFARHAVPLSHVLLEVTESVYMDEGDRKVSQTLDELRSDGVRVALDDFGTGYASLTHLLNFPVDIIKVDKRFVDKLSVGGPGGLIIKALLDIASGLGMRIVAEGVETESQAADLQRLGCRYAQGYLFGRPADRDTTTEVLRRGALADRRA
ncbi:putative bifunctional diguanylate cyclase/phosphodiesterase [Paraburkholderia acidisoli]|uniref:EAL domain-containing protein n=1 Tax=Paraburkholderia acidisoli TaxID=2571748 RepID=A0A7Z2GKH7_9BURK|nr:EAL domain-containing protein [Paraburkholderia acidisoli]QGZ63179.1 EAL domain-containing protein [Paraburkholderia acidisoli]